MKVTKSSLTSSPVLWKRHVALLLSNVHHHWVEPSVSQWLRDFITAAGTADWLERTLLEELTFLHESLLLDLMHLVELMGAPGSIPWSTLPVNYINASACLMVTVGGWWPDGGWCRCILQRLPGQCCPRADSWCLHCHYVVFSRGERCVRQVFKCWWFYLVDKHLKKLK